MGTFLDWAVFHVRNRGSVSWVTNCQRFHKLTCKPVAFAFPRPCYVVMFTPWPQTGSHCASCCSHHSPHTSAFIYNPSEPWCIWHMDDCSRDDHTILYSSIQYNRYLEALLQIQCCSIKGFFFTIYSPLCCSKPVCCYLITFRFKFSLKSCQDHVIFNFWYVTHTKRCYDH